MSKYINLLGYSLWVPSVSDEANDESAPTAPLYSPAAIAIHTLIFGLFFGLALYGVNLNRRGERRKGRVFVMGSFALIILSLVLVQPYAPELAFLSGLVAFTLYRLEKPHFDYAIRHGGLKARWWLPTLFGIGLLFLQGLIFLLNIGS